MKSGLFVTKDKTRSILKGLLALPKKDVLVGIPQEHAYRDNDDDTSDITNAQLGYIHNYGAPEANIPARPFLEEGIKNVQGKINQYFKQAGQAALKGNPELLTKCLHAAGVTAQAGVRDKIQQGPFLPLAPGTLAARRRRGRTGEKPLLDTGQMRTSITYVIRTKR